MTAESAGNGSDAVNRELWTKVGAEYAEERAFRAWPAAAITRSAFKVPEAQTGVLDKVSGRDVLELGCGTAYELGASPGAKPYPYYGLAPAQTAA